jgi:trimeric autotransporter adhesin
VAVRFIRFIVVSLSGLACFAATYTIQTVAGTSNAGDGGLALSAALGQPEGIAVDTAGNVYVADAAANCVRVIAPDGTIQTFAGTGVAGFSGDGGPAVAAQLNQPYGLAFDTDGNLYIADLGNARVRKVSVAGVIQTFAGGGAFPATSQGQGGPAVSAQLMQPRNVTLTPGGILYISDFGANQVYEVAGNGMLLLVAGNGVAGFSGDSTSALLAQLNAPAGLAVDYSGALYIADSGNNRVRKVDDGVIITVFNTPSPTGLAFGSGALYVAASSYFGTVSQQIPSIPSAVDVTVDLAGDIFATSGAFVVEIPAGGANGVVVTTIAGSGATPNFGGDNGPATAAQLNAPSSVVMDSSGDWYIADTANNRIRMVTPEGVINTIAGTATAGFSGDNGLASAAQLNSPRGLAIDISGNLYIADSGNNEVREITPAGLILPVATQLNNPVSVATDALGSVYIADSGNNRIVKVTATGTTSILATINGPQAVAVDASGNVLVADATQIWSVTPAGAASSMITGLNAPTAIAVVSDGSLLIAEPAANVIQQWASGSLATIAGTGTAGFSGDGNPALSAQLNGPAGIGIGANGVFWIADSANNRIRSLTPIAGTSVTGPTASLSVVNAASLADGPIAPGEIITVFGSGFGATGAKLLFGSTAATLFYTSATQINALAPASLPANSNSMLSVIVNGTSVAKSSTPVVSAAPGIFTIAGGGGQAAAINYPGATLNSASNPAACGTIVSLYATGQGSNSGAATLTIGGYTAQLLYAGPAPGFPGLMQINAQIPGGFLAPGIQPVVLSIGGAASQAGVTIATQCVLQ